MRMSTPIKSIVLFGASGKTGQAIITEAKNHHIDVRSITKRNPTDVELSQTIRGSNAVLIVFGPRPPYTDIFCQASTERIISAMKAAHVSRIICQTGAMIGDYPQNRSFIFELFSARFRKSNPDGYNDRVQQEKAVMTSSLEWIIIKPPRLTDSQDDMPIHAGVHIGIGLLSSVSRKSLAQFIMEELLTPHHIYQAVFVKN